MSILIALLIGGAIGAVAGYYLRENLDHIVLNVLIGICGSIVGMVFSLALPATNTDSLINIPAALCSIIGALIFVLIFNFLQKLFSKRAAHVDTTEEKPDDVREIEEKG